MASNVTVSDLVAVGHGIERPEHVMVTADGRLLASDKASAVAEVSIDGRVRRIGSAGGEPNGFAVSSTGTAIIANFGHGVLQEVDLESGATSTILEGQVCGRSIQWVNFALVDSHGGIWVSVSTENPDLMDTIASGAAEGFLFHLDRDRSNATIVADRVNFPNCMALDHDERYLYVVRTLVADVVRFPIQAGGSLGPRETYGPRLGDRRPDEYGPGALRFLEDPETMRRWGMADGCGFDADGNLWVTLVFGNRVVAVTSDGEVLTVIEDAAGTVLNSPTSVAWGGADMRDVYFGSLASPYVVKGRSSVPGMRMVHQVEGTDS